MAAADFWWLVPSPRDDGSPKANHQISPGITHSPSRLSLSDLRRNVRASIGLCIYWPAHPAASPLSAGCSSEQRFACSFLRIPPHDGHPCCSANTSPCRVCRGLTPPSECALPGAPNIRGALLECASCFSIPCSLFPNPCFPRGPRGQGPPRTGLGSWGRGTGPRPWGGYCTVSTIVVECVVAVIPLLDCAVTSSVYVPAGVGRFCDGPWL